MQRASSMTTSRSTSDRLDELLIVEPLRAHTTILSFPLSESQIVIELLPGLGLIQGCCTDFPPRQPGLSSVR